MEFKKYTATEGNTLLNLDSLSYGSIIWCAVDSNLNIIEMPKEEAEYYRSKYQDAINSIPAEESVQETPILLKNRMMKASLVEESSNSDSSKNSIKDSFIEELTSNGYDINNKVEPIICAIK